MNFIKIRDNSFTEERDVYIATESIELIRCAGDKAHIITHGRLVTTIPVEQASELAKFITRTTGGKVSVFESVN